MAVLRPTSSGSAWPAMTTLVTEASQPSLLMVSMATGPTRSSSPGPPSANRPTSTVSVRCGRSPATSGLSATSSQPRQISPIASARLWAGVRSSSSPFLASASMTAANAVMRASPVSGSRSPSTRTMPLRVADACSLRPARSWSKPSLSVCTRSRQYPMTLWRSFMEWWRAASINSASARANSPASTCLAVASAFAAASDTSPDSNAARVRGMSCNARAQRTCSAAAARLTRCADANQDTADRCPSR